MLEKQLALAQQSLLEYRNYVQHKLDLPTSEEAGPSINMEPVRDDDKHYFDSYAQNGESKDEMRSRLLMNPSPIARDPCCHDPG